MYKQVIVIRSDLKIGKGKIASQAAHASLAAYKKSGFFARMRWEAGGAKKVVVKANSEKELMEIYEKARHMRLPCALIRDAGKTQIESGTATSVGIGPAEEKRIDAITKHLKLL